MTSINNDIVMRRFLGKTTCLGLLLAVLILVPGGSVENNRVLPRKKMHELYAALTKDNSLEEIKQAQNG